MEYGTMLDRLKKMIEEDPDNINILEEVIDVNLQLKYFKVSVKVKKDLNPDEVLANMDLLFEGLFTDIPNYAKAALQWVADNTQVMLSNIATGAQNMWAKLRQGSQQPGRAPGSVGWANDWSS